MQTLNTCGLTKFQTDCYATVIQVMQTSQAYKSHSFCKAKNGTYYLKVNTNRGRYLTRDEAVYLDTLTRHLAGNNAVLKFNSERGNFTLKIYDRQQAQ